MSELQHPNNGDKKKKAFLIVGIIAAFGLAAGYFYRSYTKTHISTDDAFIEGNIHTISPRINGNIISISVRDNQPVKRGEVLAELDKTEYRSKVEAARANLELQQTVLRYAEQERKRAEALYKTEVSSTERYEKAVAAHETAIAQVKLAAEQLRQAELNLSYTVITSPADGYITRRSAQIGNRVQTGQPLMAVVSLDELWVTANFKETQLERIRPGQPVRIRVDSFPDRVFSGTVDSIMAGTGSRFSLFPPENATGNYVKVVQRIPVKIRFHEEANKDHILRIGMSVVPTVIAQ